MIKRVIYIVFNVHGITVVVLKWWVVYSTNQGFYFHYKNNPRLVLHVYWDIHVHVLYGLSVQRGARIGNHLLGMIALLKHSGEQLDYKYTVILQIVHILMLSGVGKMTERELSG